MATYSRVKTFVANETLTASDLNAEFNNIITNTNSGNLNSDNVSTSSAWTWTGYHTYSTSSRIALSDDIYMTLGNATDGDYRVRYNATSTALEIMSTDSDGAGTDAVVLDIQDGTDDLRLRGGFSTDNNTAPTSGIVTGGNIVSDTDSTDDLGTTSVRWANLYVDAATITNNLTVGGTLTLTGGLTLNGNVTVGDSASDTLTINSTITSNLLFTDNTYDIGASGATRPRDLFLSRNAVMGGTLGVTGLITATGGVSGALTGNVTGNLTGDVTGNISGNVTGGTISGTTATFSGDLAVGTDKFFVDVSASAVGVGTNSPSGLGVRSLNVKAPSSGGADLTVEADNGNNFGVFYSGATASDPFSIFSNTGFKFATASDKNATGFDEHMRITSTGVGINCTPKDTLHVRIGTNLNWQFGYPNNSVTTLAALNDVESAYVTARIDAGTLELNGQSGGDVNLCAGALFVDASADRVGLGTTSPAALAHLYSNSSGANTELRVEHNNASSTATAMMRFKRAGADFAYVGGAATAISGASTTDLGLTVPSGKNIVFATDNTERARITSGGTLELRSSSGGQVGTLQLGSDATYHAKVEWEYSNNELAHTINNVGNHTFNTNGSEVVRITSDGITFNGDTSSNNALDDYEEGTWTPTINGSTTNPTVTYSVSTGVYTKIGNTIFMAGYVYVTAGNLSGGAGNILIGNIPYSIAATTAGGYAALNLGYSRVNGVYIDDSNGQARLQNNLATHLYIYGTNSSNWGSGVYELSFFGTLKVA